MAHTETAIPEVPVIEGEWLTVPTTESLHGIELQLRSCLQGQNVCVTEDWGTTPTTDKRIQPAYSRPFPVRTVTVRTFSDDDGDHPMVAIHMVHLNFYVKPGNQLWFGHDAAGRRTVRHQGRGTHFAAFTRTYTVQ
jgi:hypothetical protein